MFRPGGGAPSKEPWLARALREAPGILAVATVVLAVFRPLVTMRQLLITGEAGTSDALFQTYPFRLLLGRALAAGHLPLWTDDFYSGYPLLANPSVGSLYPPNWLFGLLPGPAAMALTILLACMMAGWFAYYYCRTIGLGRAPSTLAGMSFATCGVLVCHVKHIALVSSAAWLPLQLALVERAVRTRSRGGLRAALWLAPVTALQLLAGGVQMAYLAVLGTALYALARLLCRESRPLGRWRLKLAAVLLAAIAWGLVMASGQMLPSLELARVSERTGGLSLPLADIAPMPPRDLLTLGWSGAVGWAGDRSYFDRHPDDAGIFWEDYCYVGWPVLVLGVAAVPALWRRRLHARLMLGGSLLGVALGLGVQTGLFLVAFFVIPGLSYFRFPQRFLLWAELGLAVLGAMGLALLLERVRPRLRRPLAVLVLALVLADLAVAQGRLNIYYDAAAWAQPPPTVALVRSGDPQARVACFLPTVAYVRCIEHGGLAGNRPQFWRDRALLQPDGNVFWHIPQASGYTELVPRWLALVWHGQHLESLNDWMADFACFQTRVQSTDLQGQDPSTVVLHLGSAYVDMLRAWNVHWLLSAWPVQAPGLRQVAQYDQVRAYQVSGAYGRAYLVPMATDIRSDDGFVRQARFAPEYASTVYLQGLSTRPQADFRARPLPVTVSPDRCRATVRVSAPAPCWLVLTDTWYPGWQATVNGRPAQIHRGNATMRAVRVPAGTSRVEFRYRCRPLALGTALALAALLLWLPTLWLLPRRLR